MINGVHQIFLISNHNLRNSHYVKLSRNDIAKALDYELKDTVRFIYDEFNNVKKVIHIKHNDYCYEGDESNDYLLDYMIADYYEDDHL